ncbi:SCO family protein [Alkalibacillus aidingensis]|uniref:SCO family protein n=1 Tax=Alkalibacillus aidingensis TaxID=2747607 RepID=UPI001660C5B3|nr:SCO family protein [Alkalibacillus aidingensis]
MLYRHKHVIWLIGITGLLLILSGCNSQDIEQELQVDVESFEYMNQDEEMVSLEDLKGDYWVANFIFTNCETVCPPMTSNMANLQDEADELGLDVRFVSFSVDPELDDPETLREFADQFEADYSNWDFLTGYSQEEIESFAANSFKTLVTKVDGEDQVNHGTTFFIVDPEGTAIHNFSGTQLDEMDQIIDHLEYYLN